MYAKIFEQIYDSSLANDYLSRFVFIDLLVLADSDGVVDMTHEAISRRTNVPLKTVRNAIVTLEKPDPRSRSPKFDGVRLKRLDEHRDWGWVIVNYEHYRKLASEDDRKAKTRDRVRKFRELHGNETPKATDDGNAPVTPGNADVTKCNTKEKEKERDIQKEKDKKTEGDARGAKESPRQSKISDGEWLERLKADATYAGIDVGLEYGKMCNWCEVKGKKPSRARFVNWLNRVEKPMNGATQKDFSQW